MHRLSVTISISTILFFMFSLTANVLIADPAFTSVAFAKKGDKAKDKDSDKGKKGLRHRVDALETQSDDLQNQIETIELTPGPQGETGATGSAGTDGLAGADGTTGPTGPQGIQGPQGETGSQGKEGLPGFQGPKGEPGEDSGSKDIAVIARPAGLDGNHAPGITTYEIQPCTGGIPFESGVLANPNTAYLVSAEAVAFNLSETTLRFTVYRDDRPTQTGEVINAPIEFYVRCMTISTLLEPPTVTVSPLASTVFVTRSPYMAGRDFEGLAGADALCQGIATSRGLPGTYKAWLSDSTESPLTRFTRNPNGYFDRRGRLIASNWADLTDGSLQTRVVYNELGEQITRDSSVYTGTKIDGTGDGGTYCDNWSLSTSSITKGFSHRNNGTWTDGLQEGCNFRSRLYCFRQ